MSYRLIAADLDGTLIGDDLAISPMLLDVVQEVKRQGLYFTLATGRTLAGALPLARQIGVNAPIIIYQGGEIHDIERGELIYRATIPLDSTHEFISTVAALGLHLNVYLDDHVYVERERPELGWYAGLNRVDVHPVGDLLAFVKTPPPKMLIVASPDQLDQVAPGLQRQFAGRLQIVRSHRLFLEAIPPEVNKGVGLARLAGHLGVPREEVVAIGDNDNDAEMVEWAGLGIAMGNGSHIVKRVADVVAPPVQSDGAAWAIRALVLDFPQDELPDGILLSRCSVPELKDDILVAADIPANVDRAVEFLRAGRLVAFPTDTVYGIGADVRQPDAVHEIYIAKRRSPDKAIPLLVAGLDDVKPFVSSIPDASAALIDAFWPGPLTLVLPIAAGVPAIISPGPGIAVRMPDHPVALDLIRRLGAPIVTTSANVSGQSDATTAAEVWEQLGRRVDLILDGGQTAGMRPSTVVDLTASPARLLRIGAISPDQLRRFVPELSDSNW